MVIYPLLPLLFNMFSGIGGFNIPTKQYPISHFQDNDSVQINFNCHTDTVTFSPSKLQPVYKTQIKQWCGIRIIYDEDVSGVNIFCESTLNPIVLELHTRYKLRSVKDGTKHIMSYSYNNKHSGEDTLTVTADYNGTRRVIATKTFTVVGENK